MTDIFKWSDEYINELCKLNPMVSTLLNNHRYDAEWGDLTMNGVNKIKEFLERKLSELKRFEDSSLTYHIIYKYIKNELDYFIKEEYYYDINSHSSTFQTILRAYDSTYEDYKPYRYKSLPTALDQYADFLLEAVKKGKTVHKRQIEQVIDDCYKRNDLPILKQFAEFLKIEYMPYTCKKDSVGVRRYKYYIDRYAGCKTNLDLHELYEWGYKEITRLRGLMKRMKNIDRLMINSKEEFRKTIVKYQQDAFNYVRNYFNLDSRITIPDIKFDPLYNFAATYHQPSSNFGMNGYITYPQNFPLDMTQEMTTAFHEGFPGHHLQLCLKVLNSKNLTSIQRFLISCPVYEEGWGLYAEHLMVELGYYKDKDPVHLYGKYQAELFRACRVVMDIGLHNGYVNKLTGRTWSFDQVVQMLINYCGLNEVQAKSEALRYCANPFQAVTYKLGCRQILKYRERWLKNNKDKNIQDFHTKFLNLGCADLDFMDDIF